MKRRPGSREVPRARLVVVRGPVLGLRAASRRRVAEPTCLNCRVEVDLDRRAVCPPDLDLVHAGAVAVLLLDLENGAAAGRLERCGLRLLGGRPGDRRLRAAADRLGDPDAADREGRAAAIPPATRAYRRLRLIVPPSSFAVPP